MGYKLYLNIICPNPKKGATKNIGGLYCLEMYFLSNIPHVKNWYIRITR